MRGQIKSTLMLFQDYTVDIQAQLDGIPPEKDLDISLYMRILHAVHKHPRVYGLTAGALEELKACKEKLNNIDAETNYGLVNDQKYVH